MHPNGLIEKSQQVHRKMGSLVEYCVEPSPRIGIQLLVGITIRFDPISVHTLCSLVGGHGFQAEIAD